MEDELEGMTQDRWSRLSQAERERLKDRSQLHPKLVPFIGKYVMVTPKRGPDRKSKFVVGITTGWRPVILAVKRGGIDSSDIVGVDEVIDTVTPIKNRGI